MNYKYIMLCCPQGVTGGPEALHQLVHVLREYGHAAYILYYPFDKSFDCPKLYKRYNAPQGQWRDEQGDLIVVPEVATWILPLIKNAKAAVWWLSVDNYFRAGSGSALRDLVRRYKTLLYGVRMPLSKMQSYRHFAQSCFAETFLRKHKLRSQLLTDYLSDEHLLRSEMPHVKRDIVAYNPRKGIARTSALISSYPRCDFRAIDGMTNGEVAQLLAEAKVYIDFGHHPGKDRLPREAAMAGCCVITGTHGAAAYAEDVPIPNRYKLDDSTGEYIRQFDRLVASIFGDYASHAAEFEDYRRRIQEEPEAFRQQVKSIFGEIFARER